MDKSWIGKPRTSIEYRTGVYQFLLFAFRDVTNNGKVLCPCVNCLLSIVCLPIQLYYFAFLLIWRYLSLFSCLS